MLKKSWNVINKKKPLHLVKALKEKMKKRIGQIRVFEKT